MAWRKSPQALVELFDRVAPTDPRIERRKMFGYPCVFLNGNMLAGLHQEDFVLRLSEADRETLRSQRGAKTFEPMAGRPMREYMALPPSVLADEAALRGWLARAVAHVGALPAKAKKPRKAKRAAR